MNQFKTQNTKILVNWNTRQIISSNRHREDPEFKALIDKGYVEVGTVKGQITPYWHSEYFDPTSKDYGDNIDTIET